PNQQPGDKPMTEVWGDPHVEEGDGGHWDFSKNSNFKLPDGTTIQVTTTQQEGQSHTSALDITNGADHVNIRGIDVDQPEVSDVMHDGFQVAALQSGDTYDLGGDGDSKVQWFRENPNGQIEGEVVGAQLTDEDGTQMYEQTINQNTPYVVDPSLQPPVGTPA